jgi:hypothetical protein
LSTRLGSVATAGLITVIALGLYTFRIAAEPLSADEISVQRQAQSLWLTGHDLSGRQTPLLLQVDQEHWQQPVPVYAAVLMSALAPAEVASRLSAAVVGALSVGLLYLLLSQIYADRWTPLAAALLFAITPAQVVYARTGVEAIYVIPFVIAWLMGVRAWLSSGRLPPLLAGAVALGIGVFTQPAAPLTMGFLLAVTLAVLWWRGQRGMRSFAAVIAAFAMPVSALAVWFALLPDTYRDTFGRWAIHAAHLRYPLDGLRSLVNWTALGSRASIYWGSFDPAWLFLDGPPMAGDVLHGTAPFLFGTALLSVLGLAQLLKSGSPPWVVTLLAGAAVTPLAASTFGVPNALGLFLPLTLFAVLFAAEGIARSQAALSLATRIAAGTLGAAMLVEFAAFYASLVTR